MLHGLLPGEIDIADRTLRRQPMDRAASAAEAPGTYHLYERNNGNITELFATRPELTAYRLAPMRARSSARATAWNWCRI